MQETLFLSDLHLAPERPRITALFLEFLRTRAARCDALYVLGDLFETWAGDDDLTPENRDILDALRRLTATGTPVCLMPGNRDFLMGADLEALTGCRLIPDPTPLDLYGTRVLLLHGDTLCTDDEAYIAWRATVRNERWIREFLVRPLEERRALVRAARAQSRAATGAKRGEIMNVNVGEVERVMRAHGARTMIHGHTHRPDVHRFTLDGEPATRIVLGDWHREGHVLSASAEGFTPETLPLPGSGSG